MLKRFLIPHEKNEYRPHIFRSAGLIVVLVAIAGIVAFNAFQSAILSQTSYLASVVSSALVELTNSDRSRNALDDLAVNPLLEQAAQKKADDMASKGYFAHNSPDGLTPWHWFASVGYEYAYAGENLAIDFDDSVEVERAWMDSPLHRANIVNSNFTEIGIATANGTYQGRPTTFVVQLFGRPVARAASPASPDRQTASTEPSIIVSTDTFMAVSRAEDSAVLGESAAIEAAPNANFKNAASLLDTIVTSPSRTSQIILGILAILIVISLVLIVSIEISRKHMKHMLMGLMAFILVIALIYHFRMNILGGVIVL